MSAVPILDMHYLNENSMGDHEFVKSMLDMFVSQGRAQIDELRPLCIDGLLQEWVEVSHALKGTAAGIGAEAMRKLCADAQDMEDVSASERTRILAQIEDAYNKVLQAMKDEGYKP